MRTILLLLILCIALTTGPVLAGKITSTVVLHEMSVYQAYPGCPELRESDGRLNECWLGYLPQSGDNITAVPGILCIDPGCMAWCNYIGAARQDPVVAYVVKNTTLVKSTPGFVQCKIDGDSEPIFPAHTVTQQGTPNIRRWWPLMYEVPGTTFTLTILYGTATLFQDSPTNPPAWAHVEQWVWHVDADFESVINVLELFHELPFGKDEVPLISDEELFDALILKLQAGQAAFLGGDLATAGFILADFELEVMDACIDESPAFPNPTGPGTGIANTDENPACCKLLVDIEYLLQTTGIGQPKK